jgi:hypothetical protein
MGDVFHADMGVKGPLRFNNYYRSLLAVTVTAGEINTYILNIQLGDGPLEGLSYLGRLTRDATGTLAYQNGPSID